MKGPAKRRPVSKKLRFEVFKRDGFICRYCGAKPPDVILHVDHVLAVAEGGTNAIDNLVTSCITCNQGKGARGLGETTPWVDEIEVLASLQEMAERRLDLASQAKAVASLRAAEDEALATVKQWVMDELGLTEEGGVVADGSLRTFITRLGMDGVSEAIRITANRLAVLDITQQWKAWKYFCGVCWRIIKESADEGEVE